MTAFRASRLLALLLLLASTGCASTGGAPSQQSTPSQQRVQNDAARTYAPATLRADVDYLMHKVQSVHPEPDVFVPADSLQQRARRIKRSIDEPLTQAEFFVRVAPLLSGLDDGHSYVHRPRAPLVEYASDSLGWFPLKVMIAEGRLYATGSAVESGRPVLGRELLRIGGVPASEVAGRLLAQMGGQNAGLRAARLEEGYEFAYHLQLTYGFEPPFALTYRTSAGDTSRAQLEGASSEAVRALLRRKMRPPQGYRPSSNDIGVLTVRSFGSYPGGFYDFLERSFEQTRADGVRDLVIDLRGNPGGDPTHVQRLLDYLSSDYPSVLRTLQARASADLKAHARTQIPPLLRPFGFFLAQNRRLQHAEEGTLVDLTDTFTPADPLPPDRRYRGRVWILTGSRVGSAASTFAGLVKERSLGTLVGQPTGGTDGVTFGSAFALRMPGSDLAFVLPGARTTFSTTGKIDARGVTPDVHVERSASDEARGVDTEMARVFELIEKRRTASFGGK